MIQEKYNEDLLRRVVKEVVDYVFQNRDKFQIYDGTVLKLTNAEIKRIIEDKYGSEIWNRLPCSAKLYKCPVPLIWLRGFSSPTQPPTPSGLSPHYQGITDQLPRGWAPGYSQFPRTQD